ncbi:Ethylene-insensitive protein 2 [Acorus calamus]|uniref:Ethylene-insensitive protein 2 n=1 Tax=Acorus calamus TaxID=4465 RepID=A0AAV9C4B8_ACOCL|nr:Ethylene-insensitive protein 2 [Acorus calamus]
MVPRKFPYLGPALLISMGYIDLGKWVTMVDGGIRFGFDLVSMVLVLNCAAILCHYFAARVAVVTGKNLAQICSEEYSKSTCMVLGVQVELSMIISDLISIMGIAHALNLLLGIEYSTCIFLAALDAVLFPILVTCMEKYWAEVAYVSISGITLLVYILGMLVRLPEIPPLINGVFPRISRENAYSIMALLGANIIPHNFYVYSSVVQQTRRQSNVPISAIYQDHFFAIILVFSGLFLVNYGVMNSAASVFHSASLDVLTLQDAFFLMDQIFRSPVVPFIFFLVLFLSSHITALTWTFGGQVVLHNLFGIHLPAWVHRVSVKSLVAVVALSFAQSSGAEGLYQLLISCQILLAMLLPSSVIPLFRVASSRQIMGPFKIPLPLEVFALCTFIGIFALNGMFVIELLFGESSWITNFSENMGTSTLILYFFLLIIACTSLVTTLYLLVTPVYSASDGSDVQTLNWLQKPQPELSHSGNDEDTVSRTQYDGGEETVEVAEAEELVLERSVDSQSEKSDIVHQLDLPETVVHYNDDHQQSHAIEVDHTMTCTSPASNLEELNTQVEPSQVMPMPSLNKLSSDELLEACPIKINETVDVAVVKDVGVSVDGQMEKDDDEGDHGTLTCEGPPSLKSISGKHENAAIGSGILSKQSELGRAARRQLSAILDEFWGKLFDSHGKLVQDAKDGRFGVILGLDPMTVTGSSTVKQDDVTYSESAKFFQEERGPVLPREYDSPRHQMSSMDSLYGGQMTSSSWSPNMQLDAYIQSATRSILESGERRYSSLHVPQYAESKNYQPATIHGYKMSSYLGRNSDLLDFVGDQSAPKSSSFGSNYRDPLAYPLAQNGLGSLQSSGIQTPAIPRAARFPSEISYYNPPVASSEAIGSSSGYTKKYHSLPDISGLFVSNRSSSLANKNAQWGGPIGPRPSMNRAGYPNSVSRVEGVPLAFDELSPSKLYRNIFPQQLSSNLETKSLWSKQPFEQLFGVETKSQNQGGPAFEDRASARLSLESFSLAESESRLLHSVRSCIMKVLKLEGSECLFRQNGGFDEDLMSLVAAKERYLCVVDSTEDANLAGFAGVLVPHCGDGCVWQAGLIMSFGVWCIRRILELSLMESRPELWGKYTYVLNRLQGIRDSAFSKPRTLVSPCSCLDIPSEEALSGKPERGGQPTTARMLLNLIKEVEVAVASRKGRRGTAAGDVAFPKGKENLLSVLKRYKHELNKSAVAQEANSAFRKAPTY